MTTWRLFPLLALSVSPAALIADGGTVITVGVGEVLDLSSETDEGYRDASLKLGGTVKRTAGDAQYHFFDGGVELTGPATINNTVRTGFAYGSTFDMNGYKLTRTGWGNDGWLFFNDTTFVDPGDIDHQVGYLAFQGRIQGTSSARSLNSYGGIMLSNVAASDPLAFKFNVAADSALTVVGGQVTTQEGDYNIVTGELVVGAGKKLSVDVRANTFVTFGTKTTNNGTIEKNGAGTMILGGTVALANSRYDVKAGSLRIGGDPTASSFVRKVYVTGGLLEFINAGFVQHDNNQVGTAQVASASPANPARFVVGSGTVFNGVTSMTTTRLLTGLSSGDFGMAELLAGGVQTNCMTVGCQGYGAFLQRGGKLYWKGMDTPTRDCIGYDNGAYGYVGIDGGTSEVAGRLWTGWKAGATGIIVQRGGAVTANGNANGESFHFGNGRGVYALLGGTFDGKLKLSVENTEATAVDSSSAFVVSGTDTVATISGYLAGWTKNPYTTICCLRDGGRLKSHRIAHVRRLTCADSKFYLGFDGGVFQPLKAWGYFDTEDGAYDPTSVVVYDGGCVLDTSTSVDEQGRLGRGALTPSFVGPTGKGVAAIALPTDASFSASSYIGPPLVKIAGSGVSALAIADYDNATRTVTGIRVLCPGYGYDDATTCTIASPDGKSAFSCAVTMKDHANRGGFTLRGASTVKVSMLGTNTWGGATIVEAGCLDFDGKKSFPENTDLTVCRNASVVLKHGAHAVCDFGGAGCVTNDAGTVTIDGTLVVSGEALARGEYPTFTGGVVFGENARIRIGGAEPTDEKAVRFVCLVADGGVSSVNGRAVPVEGWGEPWTARVSGTKVRVMKPQGLAIIFK